VSEKKKVSSVGSCSFSRRDGKLDAKETTGKGESECKLESVSLSLRDFAGPYFI
jgi:hypothetical protein